MATLTYPYYTISTKMEDSMSGKSTTKSVAAVNLPDMDSVDRNALANDLVRVGGLVSRIMQNVYKSVSLATKEEVI